MRTSTPPGDVPANNHSFPHGKCIDHWSDRVVIDPEVLTGKPVVRGTRLSVEFILELLAAGQSEAGILASYPGLLRDDILACLAYASYLAHEYKAYPVPV